MFSPQPDKMKISAVSLVLGASLLLLVSAPTGSAGSLRMSPDRQQFFRHESVELSCEDPADSDGSVVKKKKTGGPAESCGAGFRRLSSPSSCFLNDYQDFSGSYWCETRTGDRSDPVNITISDGGLILQIPALPVATGSDVTLSCKGKNQAVGTAYFFFNGNRVGSGREAELLLLDVQPSHEGSYWCSTDEFGSTPQGLLRVRGPPTTSRTTTGSSSCGPPAQTTPPPPPFSSILFIPLIAAGASLVPLALLVLVLVLWLWRKQTGRNRSAAEVTYAQVTFRKSAKKVPPQSSGVRPGEEEDCGFTPYCDPITGETGSQQPISLGPNGRIE